MTHPDILRREREGLPEQSGSDRQCIMCGYWIALDEDHYDTPDGYVCAECNIDYMDAYLRVAG